MGDDDHNFATPAFSRHMSKHSSAVVLSLEVPAIALPIALPSLQLCMFRE
jgi:hypothetical protein